jgi:non-ribosomal peptide synthetase component F
VLEAYAMTEAAHQMTSNPLPPSKRKPGSVGPGQGVQVAILDTDGNYVKQGGEGEICVRGENVTKGYLNNDKANRDSFTQEGWFRTGDQGKLDEDGYVIITGRIKELINRGYPVMLALLIVGERRLRQLRLMGRCFLIQLLQRLFVLLCRMRCTDRRSMLLLS